MSLATQWQIIATWQCCMCSSLIRVVITLESFLVL
jgi:hypothetical protein